jgi:hypothetical protein
MVDGNRPFWTKDKMASRQKLSAEWKEMVNGKCHRKAFLSFLGEDRLPQAILEGVKRAPTDRCYSRCNPLLLPEFTLPPKAPALLSRPRAGIQSAVALELIDGWAVEQAELMYDSTYRRFPMPPSAFLDEEYRWQLAYLYTRYTPDVFWDTLTVDSLESAAPLLIL